jgi:hypothetical protein
MDEYVSVLYEIVTRGLTTNSYKFALWRALARLAPTTDERSPKIFKGAFSPLFWSTTGLWKLNIISAKALIRTKTRLS